MIIRAISNKETDYENQIIGFRLRFGQRQFVTE